MSLDNVLPEGPRVPPPPAPSAWAGPACSRAGQLAPLVAELGPFVSAQPGGRWGRRFLATVSGAAVARRTTLRVGVSSGHSAGMGCGVPDTSAPLRFGGIRSKAQTSPRHALCEDVGCLCP